MKVEWGSVTWHSMRLKDSTIRCVVHAYRLCVVRDDVKHALRMKLEEFRI